MQLGTWTIPLLPAVAVGAAVVLAVLVGWGVSRARRRSVAAAAPPVGETVEADAGPRPEDWTGEAAGGAADPLPPRRTTVADAVAARGADTPAYGSRVQWPAERPYAAPERHHPGGDTTVRTSAVAVGVTAPDAAGPAEPSDTSAMPAVGAAAARPASERAAAPAAPSTDTTALPTVDAAGPRPAATATSPAGGVDGPGTSAREATARPRSRPADDTPAPSATDPAEAGTTAVGPAAAGVSTAGTGTDTAADGTVAADRAGTGRDPAGTVTAEPGPTRPRTGPRHAYTPVPTPPAAARAAFDPWAVEPEPGPDPWAAPPAPDPTVALAAPDATAQLAAHEPRTGQEPDGAAAPRPQDTVPTATGDAAPTGSLPDARDVAVPIGPHGVAPAADAEPGPVESADSALPGRGDVTRTVEDVQDPDGEHPDLRDDAVDSGPVPPPWSAARSDPDVSRADAGAAPISVAVAQALAAREVHRNRESREDGTDPDPDQVPGTDARDRLLSVLLADPAAALGAATELDDTRARIDRLGDVLRLRRADLATAVRRLHASGLTESQIGRLAGLPDDDVRAILERRTEEDPADR